MDREWLTDWQIIIRTDGISDASGTLTAPGTFFIQESMHAPDTEQISGDNILVEQDVKAPGTEDVPARVKTNPAIR